MGCAEKRRLKSPRRTRQCNFWSPRSPSPFVDNTGTTAIRTIKFQPAHQRPPGDRKTAARKYARARSEWRKRNRAQPWATAPGSYPAKAWGGRHWPVISPMRDDVLGSICRFRICPVRPLCKRYVKLSHALAPSLSRSPPPFCRALPADARQCRPVRPEVGVRDQARLLPVQLPP
jgi:hypothetical protein